MLTTRFYETECFWRAKTGMYRLYSHLADTDPLTTERVLLVGSSKSTILAGAVQTMSTGDVGLFLNVTHLLLDEYKALAGVEP